MMGVKGPSQAAANPALAGVEIGQGPATPLNENKDQKTASTAPAFGDVWKKMQAEYGVKAEKPREIKKTLGKDDFLRIMVTQMQHQDPTSPFKADQMAQQMAQYASVEQLQNMNSQLSKMTTQNQPLERLAMTGLIGKVVTVDKERFPHTEGNKDTLGFELPKDAAQVKKAPRATSGKGSRPIRFRPRAEAMSTRSMRRMARASTSRSIPKARPAWSA